MTSHNKGLVRRFVEEVVNRGNKKLLADLVAADHVRHAPDGDLYGHEGVRIDVAEWRAGFPDLTLVLEDLIAEGDRVVSRFVLRGTHAGPFRGVAPTGRRVELAGIGIDRICRGQLAESWLVVDAACLVRPPGAPPPSNREPRHPT